MLKMLPLSLRPALFVLSCILCGVSLAAEKRPLTLPDIMQFREIQQVSITDNGNWMVYVQTPDRGDSSGHVHGLSSDKRFSIPLAYKAQLNQNGTWASFLQKSPLLEREQADPEQKKKVVDSGLLLNTTTGEKIPFENVKSIGFSGDSRFAVVHLSSSTNENDEDQDEDKSEAKTEAKTKKSTTHFLKDNMLGSDAIIINLTTGEQNRMEFVQSSHVAEKGPGIVYVIADKDGLNNQLIYLNTQSGEHVAISKKTLAAYPHVALSKSGTNLAFLEGSYSDAQATRQHELFTFTAKKLKAIEAKANRKEWFISHDNELVWSEDEKRVFFGEKPIIPVVEKTVAKITQESDLFDPDKIVAEHSLVVWHGDDPWIKTHEMHEYKDEQARFYLSAYLPERKKHIAIADVQIRNAKATNNSNAILVFSDMPYRKARTWEGNFSDLYHVSLKTGKRQLIEKRVSSYTDAEVSPSGRYVCFYHNGAFWLFDARNGNTQNLTQSIETPFANELHDYPYPAPGYGIAGWLERDKGVLVYDRYDVWLITPKGKAKNLTQGNGRKRKVQYRVVETNSEQQSIDSKSKLLLTAYYDELKHFAFYELDLAAEKAPKKLLEDQKKFSFIAKAQDSDALLYTREDMGEFPDLWLTTDNFSTTRKLTTVNPQIDEFLWGEPELVNWRSSKGKPLQGVLIKPANYQPGQRYPVLVYYYRYFSQRMYAFNQMKVNHRPNFPYYTGNGYAVFLPDIKFDIGTPGPSATDALVPGIQKLVDMGIADENAIGLHGHSWSGYQTAFVITQTDVFKAAVAGAPVSNMTSAYSGIRLGSGLARQFQYEQTQSRIGGSLFDKLELYIENSPVFFADRINTPLLIQFGDIDDAVPWQQGIELYLAMRRLNKPVIMLQYQEEPHHLKKYANKVDYTQKMRAFFDHHLKGMPAPKWMTEGLPYTAGSDD